MAAYEITCNAPVDGEILSATEDVGLDTITYSIALSEFGSLFGKHGEQALPTATAAGLYTALMAYWSDVDYLQVSGSSPVVTVIGDLGLSETGTSFEVLRMSATFDATLATETDRVRYLLGDCGDGTTTAALTDALLTDELIEAMLALYPYSQAVAQLAQGLINRFSQEPDEFKAGAVTLKWSERIKTWQSIITQMRSGSNSDVRLTTVQSTETGTTTASTTADKATAAMDSFRSD